MLTKADGDLVLKYMPLVRSTAAKICKKLKRFDVTQEEIESDLVAYLIQVVNETPIIADTVSALFKSCVTAYSKSIYRNVIKRDKQISPNGLSEVGFIPIPSVEQYLDEIGCPHAELVKNIIYDNEAVSGVTTHFNWNCRVLPRVKQHLEKVYNQ